MDKQDFRKKLIAARKALSAGEVEYRSQQIYKQFLSEVDTLVSNETRSIALYFPIRGEVDTRPLFRYFLNRQKICLFPRLTGTQMDFYPVRDWSQLQIGTYGIGEPQPGLNAAPVRPDLVIVPGVAFSSADLHRLGFGGGNYDRAIDVWRAQAGQSAVRLIALAYDFQIVPSLPREAHDHAVDFVVTEQRVYPETSVA